MFFYNPYPQMFMDRKMMMLAHAGGFAPAGFIGASKEIGLTAYPRQPPVDARTAFEAKRGGGEPGWGEGPFEEPRVAAWILLPHLLDSEVRPQLTREDVDALTDALADELMHGEFAKDVRGHLQKAMKDLAG